MNEEKESYIFALRTTANREDQVLDFVAANAERKGIKVYSLFRPHGLRGYIFVEAASRQEAEEAVSKVPYARGLLTKDLEYSEVEAMLEQIKGEVNIKKNDIVEIITGPFKKEKARVVRIEQLKEEVIVELLEAAVPIPITVKLDSVKVIRREDKEDGEATHHNYITLRNEILPVVHLKEYFDMTLNGLAVPVIDRDKRNNLVVVMFSNRKIGLFVDELLGEVQAVIKPLGKVFKDLNGFAGFTILGSGMVALVLDIPGLIKQVIGKETSHFESVNRHSIGARANKALH